MVSIDIEVVAAKSCSIYGMSGDTLHLKHNSEEIVSYPIDKAGYYTKAIVFKTGSSLGAMFVEEGDDRFDDAVRALSKGRME